MKHLVRIATLLAVFAAAGCVSNAEVGQTNAVATESSSLYAEMHAAIPASRTPGNVFEYN
jgi:outer membrane murein-binding lipoprotein Lpp